MHTSCLSLLSVTDQLLTPFRNIISQLGRHVYLLACLPACLLAGVSTYPVNNTLKLQEPGTNPPKVRILIDTQVEGIMRKTENAGPKPLW